MKSFLKSYFSKFLFLLLLINPEARPAILAAVPITAEVVVTLTTMGVAAITLALAQYQTNKNGPISIDIGNEGIPIQIIDTIGKSEKEITNEIIHTVSRNLGEIYRLPEAAQKIIENQLHENKQEAINAAADPKLLQQITWRFNNCRMIMDQLRHDNRIKGQIQEENAINIFKFKNTQVRNNKKSKAAFLKVIQRLQRTLVNWNHPDLAIRADSRINSADLIELLDPDLFGDAKEIVLRNLQARYFHKGKLVDLSYDKRLPETMWLILRNHPFYWSKEELAKFVDTVEKNKLDRGGSFKRLYRRVSNELSVDERQYNKEYEPQRILGKGKYFSHDRHKQILNDPENFRISRVTLLCRQGDLGGAYTIANGVTTIKSTMIKIINFCCQEYCNKFGILKRYEHLPSWQNLSYAEKTRIASKPFEQTRMNRQLPEEVVKCHAEAVLQKEAELKIASELEIENKQTYQLYNLYTSYIAKRLKAFEQSNNTNFQHSYRCIPWSNISSEFMRQFELDNLDTGIDGTPTQHALQHEFYVIAQNTARIWKAHGNSNSIKELVTHIKQGIAHNQVCDIVEAAQCADLAWTTLDQVQIINEFTEQEAINAAQEAKLKTAADSTQKEKQKSLAPAADSPTSEQPISTPAPLPPQQDDPDKDKKPDSEQVKTECPVPPPGENKFLENKSQHGHRWDNRPGHVEETPENRKLIYDMANDQNCYNGPDDHEIHWYSKILKDGKQAWAEVRNNQIRNCGINEPNNIRTYNPKTGLKALKPSRVKITPGKKL